MSTWRDNSSATLPTLWHNAVYGKFWEDGLARIRRGADYEWTGWNKAIPDAVLQECTVENLGVGVGGVAMDWSAFPFIAEGIYAQRPLLTESGWYMVCCRLARFLEDPDAIRHYLHSNYLFAPMANDVDKVMPSLASATKIGKKQTRRTDSLEPLTLEPVDFELPPSWIEKVSNYVMYLVAGETVEVHVDEDSPSEVLNRFQLIVSCFPVAIRWLLPISAPTLQSSAHAALTQTFSMTSNVRKIGADWLENKPIDLSNAKNYLRWLTDATRSCRSLVELRNCIDKEVPQFLSTWDSIVETTWFKQSKQDWRAAMHAVREFTALRKAQAWLTSNGSALCIPKTDFTYGKNEWFAKVNEHLENSGVAGDDFKKLDFLCRSSLVKCFGEVPEKHSDLRALGMLLGKLPLQPSVREMFATSLPSDLLPSAASTVIGKLRGTKELGEWIDLIQQSLSEKNVNWLICLRASFESELLWSICRLQLRTGNDLLRLWIDAPASVRALGNLIAGLPPAAGDFQLLLNKVGDCDEETLCSLTSSLKRPDLIPYGFLLEVKRGLNSGHCCSFFSRATLMRTESQDEVLPNVALQVVTIAEALGFPDCIVDLVLLLWGYLSNEIQIRMTPKLASIVAPAVFYTVTGEKPKTMQMQRGQFRIKTEKLKHLGILTSINANVRSRIQSSNTNKLEGYDDLLSTIRPSVRSWPIECFDSAALRFIAEMLAGNCKILPPLSDDDGLFIIKFVNSVSVPYFDTCRFTVTELGQLKAACAVACSSQTSPEMVLPAEVLRDAIEEQVGGSSPFWDLFKERVAWTNPPGGWRLLCRQRTETRLTENEFQALALMSDSLLLTLLLNGMTVPVSLFGKFHYHTFLTSRISIEDAQRLASLAFEEADGVRIFEDVLLSLLHYCKFRSLGEPVKSFASAFGWTGRVRIPSDIRKGSWSHLLLKICDRLSMHGYDVREQVLSSRRFEENAVMIRIPSTSQHTNP